MKKDKTKTNSKNRKKKKILLALLPLLAIVLLLAAYTIYSLAHTSYALHTLEEYSADYPKLTITKDAEGDVSVLPKDNSANNKGIVFYQGASVEPLAYVPLLSELAEEGYCVYIPQFPCGMAAFDANAADEIIEEHPEIDSWFIAGHSLGGRVASKYAALNGSKLLGVIVISSPIDKSFTDSDLPVLMLYGELDGIYHGIEPGDALPSDASVQCINGANHAQFGDYGHQLMDKDAAISAEEQRSIGAAAMLEWLSTN